MILPTNVVDDAISRIRARRPVNSHVSVNTRIALCRESLDFVLAVSDEWADAALRAKGLPDNSPLLAEDLLSGPVVVARQLQLMIQTLQAISAGQWPRLPGLPYSLPSGQLAVPVFPTNGFFDNLAFIGLNAHVRLQDGCNVDGVHGKLPDVVCAGDVAELCAVLGAGNVSSIPATDSLNQMVFEGRQVLLKMNPVNEYLAPIFRKAFSPFIREGLLEIITGAADIGSQLAHHAQVSRIHITGSVATHDAIVWGTDGEAAELRRHSNQPLLNKPATSELGNVTPWIIVPGVYSKRQLASQAQHVVASITNNASFNCLATKVIVTWDRWAQRDEFLSLLNFYLEQTPQRPAYYPGAAKRFQRFANSSISPDDRNCLPWTLLVDQRFTERGELFQEESFVCVCAETRLSAASPLQFLDVAADFANSQMSGTLCASITVPARFRKEQRSALQRCLRQLRYGSVCINQWSGLAYGLTSPPWGAYPGATLKDAQSGVGNVHNTYLLAGVEKTVLDGPLVNFPQPVWFSNHSNAVHVAKCLLRLYHQPSIVRIPELFFAAMRG